MALSLPPGATKPIDAIDADLIRLVVEEDDRLAFRVLLERHQQAVRSVLRRLTRADLALTDDLAQATFLRAYLTLDQFRGTAELRSWLYRIACNEFFQHYRGRRKERAQAGQDKAATTLEAALPDSSEQVLRSIDLERGMGTLSDPERQAIILCYYADLSHSEAALAMQCPVGTLKSNISRAKVKLQHALKAWAPTASELSP